MIQQIIEYLKDIVYELQKKDNFRVVNADELKNEYHQNIDSFDNTCAFYKEEYNKLARIDAILMWCGKNH